jgi:uncharacterized protein YijF (DUF1287 family)
MRTTLLVTLALVSLASCTRSEGSQPRIEPPLQAAAPSRADTVAIASDSVRTVVRAAVEQSEYTVEYDPAYVVLDYPGGDLPREKGVCADVIVRAFRAVGIDLQKEVHEDMTASFSSYPKRWGLRRPDRNIDHRRVANLMTFFERKGASLPLTSDPADYLPGDVVAWELGNRLLHIGMVTNIVDESGRAMMVHNIGQGARIEERLFAWRVIGHYRFLR